MGLSGERVSTGWGRWCKGQCKGPEVLLNLVSLRSLEDGVAWGREQGASRGQNLRKIASFTKYWREEQSPK